MQTIKRSILNEHLRVFYFEKLTRRQVYLWGHCLRSFNTNSGLLMCSFPSAMKRSDPNLSFLVKLIFLKVSDAKIFRYRECTTCIGLTVNRSLHAPTNLYVHLTIKYDFTLHRWCHHNWCIMGHWRPVSNLRDQLSRHPPVVVFFLCLLFMSITFVCIGLYSQDHNIKNPDISLVSIPFRHGPVW